MKTNNGHNEAPGAHKMGRRKDANCYYLPGLYHVTLRVSDEWGAMLGRMAGDVGVADGLPGAPCVELSAVGRIVEEELTQSIKKHYPMVEVLEYVVMPEHLHVLLIVHSRMVSSRGRSSHLGHVIAGFKKGCNRRLWELMGMRGETAQRVEVAQRGKPAAAPQDGEEIGKQGGLEMGKQGGEEMGKLGGGFSSASALGVRQAVSPIGYKVPSRLSSGRKPLFAEGYVDVMPVDARQLQTQLAYIRQNPRSRLLRSRNRGWLQTKRGGIDTALSVKALRGYLLRECESWQMTQEAWGRVERRLLIENGKVGCDSYGDRGLLGRRGEPAAAEHGAERRAERRAEGNSGADGGLLLPVVCHRRDRALFAVQKARCMAAARAGAVLVSARIAKGEQEILDAAMGEGWPVVIVADNGMGERYHPSGEKTELGAAGRLLLVTPWRYVYRHADEGISVLECKTMNCVVQALCRKADSWWR